MDITDCILWDRATVTTKWGITYGAAYFQGKVTTAHRVAWFKRYGADSIPEGHELHHKCQTPLCVNTDHLEPMTKKQHAQVHRRTHCRKGHALTGHNAKPNGVSKSGILKVTCRQCANERNRKKFRVDKPATDCEWTI